MILAGASFGLTLFFIFSNIEVNYSALTISNNEKTVKFSAIELQNLIKYTERDIFFIENIPPLQGIFRAQKNGGIDPLDGSTEDEWKNRLISILISLSQAKKEFYDQVRYIDENGKEVIRINNSGGEAKVVPTSELQYKGEKKYFIETKRLKKGELYISAIELNREGSPSKISLPYKPVIRYATPLYSDDNQIKGILIINALFDKFIQKSIHKNLKDESHQNIIIDSDGQYLLHPNHEKEWGGPENLNNGSNLKKDFPEAIVTKILSSDEGHVVYNGNLIVYKKISLNDEPSKSLTWLEISSNEKILNDVKNLVQKYGLFALLAFTMLTIGLYFFIKSILRPLKTLKESAEMLGEGNFNINIPIESQDEIGTLAESFRNMSKKIRESYSNLKRQVDEKTKLLSVKVKDLEKSKKAMLNLLEDINIEKQKIILAKARDEAILNNMGDGLIVMNKKGFVELVNPVFEEQLGWKEKEVKGKMLVDLIKMEDEDGNIVLHQKRVINKAISTNKSINNDSSKTIYYVRKNGTRFPVSIIVSPIFDNKKCIGFVEVFRDITEAKQIDKAKTEFVSMASHQLKTPLSTISWYTEMLVDEDAGKLNKDQKSYLSEINAGNKRMIELVNSLLNVSRVDLGTFAIECEMVNVLNVCKDIVKTLKPKILEKKMNIKEEYAKDTPEINADPKLLRMVIENLMSNAVKYTPEKGHVNLSVSKDKSNLIIKVKDDGYGIPKNEQKRIFTKLYRAENVRQKAVEGTGLGLYIVKAVIEQSGGKIRFESEENKGSTFFVSLPLKGMKQKKGTKGLS